MVDAELELDFDELLARPLIERDITLTCVSNEVGGQLRRQRPLARRARWPTLLERGRRRARGRPARSARRSTACTIGTPIAVVTRRPRRACSPSA